MNVLNEAEIIANVQLRYMKNNNIFTYIGPTLMVVNPYRLIKELFSEDILKYYLQSLERPNFNLKDHDPHVYAISS